VQRYPIIQPYLTFMGNPSQRSLIIGGMLLLVAIFIIKTLFLMYSISKQKRFIFNVQANLSSRLYSSYLLQSWSFHLQRNSAELIQNITKEVELFINIILQQGMACLTESLVFMGITVVLFLVEPIGALVVTGTLALVSFVFQYAIRKRILHWGNIRQYHDRFRLQHLKQAFGGVKDIKLLGRESHLITQYEVHNRGATQVTQRQQTLLDLPRLWIELLAVFGLAMLVILMLAQNKPVEVVLPILGVFAAAAFRMLPSVVRILSVIQNFRFGLPVVNTLYKEIKILDVPKESHELKKRLPLCSKLTIESVSFQYVGAQRKALDKINLTIHRGESVGFIGTSGAGKSTLVDIILGLLPPGEGFVNVDAIDIQSNVRGWQAQVGYVPQSIFLTDESLRRNVAFGLPDELIDDAAVHQAVKAAQLDEFISGLPEGLNTLVGESGVRLSGGQRQRIGIARALYHDPDVLVLDEATSALDSVTESAVMKSLNAFQGKKTLLIIAHRFSTVANCDRLYKLEKGRIMMEGSFKQVVSDNLVTQA